MNEHEIAGKPINILLVEDNEGDVVLTRKAFERAHLKNTLHVERDGEAALEFLRANPGNRPDIVLLDLNLPKIDGKQVLEQVKKDPDLQAIPVVVLTSSQADQDILTSYDLHANSYIVKPITLEKFAQVASVIEDFWFGVVKLPPNRAESQPAQAAS